MGRVGMQVKKDEIREKILKVAREQFTRFGFSGTSMRHIASRVCITTSNIYNYFSSKDHLFSEIVRSTTDEIDRALNRLKIQSDTAEAPSRDGYLTLKRDLDQSIRFVHRHREDLDLILFQSHGSSMGNFKEYFIEKYTDILVAQFEAQDRHRIQGRPGLSRFFFHNLCSFYANVVAEIIMHRVPLTKMKRYAEEISTFVFFGFRALMDGEISTE